MSNKYILKWNCHHSETFQAFDQLRSKEMFVDVTLSCEDQFLKAHKLVLSAGSKYLERILQRDGTNCPTIHFYGVKMSILKSLVEFMYNGEVEVPSVDLEKFIEVAENLEVKGLKGNGQSNSKEPIDAAFSTDYGSVAPSKRRGVPHSVEDSPYPIKQPRQAYNVKCPAPTACPVQPQMGSFAPNQSQFTADEPGASTNSNCDEVVLIKEESPIGSPLSCATAKSEEYWEQEAIECHSAVGDESEVPQVIPHDIDLKTVTVWEGQIFKGSAGHISMFFCGICGYKTVHRTNILRHSRLHTGERPFICPVCNKAFNEKKKMTNHALKAHGNAAIQIS